MKQIVSVFCVVLACCSAVAAAATAMQRAAANTQASCAADNKSNPQPLTGTLHQTDYQFTHTSDVDSGQLSQFSYILKNDHPTRLLPAKWAKASVEFDRIAVGGCARNDFDTTLKDSVDSSAPVEYGPLAQHRKPAAAYVVQQAATPIKRLTAPKLNSRIFALLENQRIDFRFTTFISDGIFHYEAQNNGSHDVPFNIPALTAAWSPLQATRPVQWPRWSPNQADMFSLTAFQVPRVQELLVSAPGVDSFREDVVQVGILSKENLQDRVAAGRVTVYLPVVAAR